MKKSLVLILVALTFLSCKSKKENDNIENTQTENAAALLDVGCYSYHGENSSIEFKITEIGENVTGNLNYHLAEKDANAGTFEGVLEDDILLGVYTFQSEGVTSERNVIFKIKDGKLIEGYGPMNEEGNAFDDIDEVTFTSTMPLTKTECKN